MNDNIDDGDDGIVDDEEGIDDDCVGVDDVGDPALTLVAAEQRPAYPRSMFPAQAYV